MLGKGDNKLEPVSLKPGDNLLMKVAPGCCAKNIKVAAIMIYIYIYLIHSVHISALVN